MKLKEITVSAEMKISKNYNSVGSVISLTAEVDKEDDVTAYEVLSEQVHTLLDKEMAKGLDELKKQVKR